MRKRSTRGAGALDGVPPPAAPAQGHLRLQEPPERLAALLREHERLRKKIEREKKNVTRLDARLREVAQRLGGEQEVMAESRRLDGEIHALFADLLSRTINRAGRGTRRLVDDVYAMLQRMGVLSPRGAGEEDRVGRAASPTPGAEPFGPDPEGDAGRFAPGSGGLSARRPDGGSGSQTIRGLFRDLALALHPDRAHDGDEKARRTEAMKQISEAYGDRDLVRLLDLKRIWLAGGAVAEGGGEIDRRLPTLERTNAALREQLKSLREESKALRRSPPLEMLRALEHSFEWRGGDALAALIAQAREEVERLRELRDFVAAFRDGKITSDEFGRGPQSMRGDASDEQQDDPEVLEALAEMLFGGPMEMPARRRRRGHGRRQRRDVRPGDMPF